MRARSRARSSRARFGSMTWTVQEARVRVNVARGNAATAAGGAQERQESAVGRAPPEDDYETLEQKAQRTGPWGCESRPPQTRRAAPDGHPRRGADPDPVEA